MTVFRRMAGLGDALCRDRHRRRGVREEAAPCPAATASASCSSDTARAAATAPPPAPPPAAPTALTEDEIFARKTLEQLNAERPLGDVFFDLDESTIRDERAARCRRTPSG